MSTHIFFGVWLIPMGWNILELRHPHGRPDQASTSVQILPNKASAMPKDKSIAHRLRTHARSHSNYVANSDGTLLYLFCEKRLRGPNCESSEPALQYTNSRNDNLGTKSRLPGASQLILRCRSFSPDHSLFRTASQGSANHCIPT